MDWNDSTQVCKRLHTSMVRQAWLQTERFYKRSEFLEIIESYSPDWRNAPSPMTYGIQNKTTSYLYPFANFCAWSCKIKHKLLNASTVNVCQTSLGNLATVDCIIYERMDDQHITFIQQKQKCSCMLRMYKYVQIYKNIYRKIWQ